jgi:uncharacterized protein
MKCVDFVCYTSKLCNLRCRYCYELPLLSDKRRMELPQIGALFEHVAEHYDRYDEPVQLRFQWHGGEPLLIEPEFYWQVFELQQRVFAGRKHKPRNIVQTNMTMLDDARIELLRDGFDDAGVSIDPCSRLRVDRRGLSVESRVLRNLDRALHAGVHLTGVTVLARPLLGRIPDVYRFWRERRMGFRLLPLERGLYAEGQDFEIESGETLRALCELADVWLADPEPVWVEPLLRHLTLLMHAARGEGQRVATHDKSQWESVVLVDTDGTMYGYGSRFDRGQSPGNLFTTPLERLLAHPTHLAVAERARARVKAACTDCPYFGRACTGDPVVEGELGAGSVGPDGKPACVVARGLIAHLERRLVQAGALDPRTRMVSRAFVHAVSEAP